MAILMCASIASWAIIFEEAQRARRHARGRRVLRDLVLVGRRPRRAVPRRSRARGQGLRHGEHLRVRLPGVQRACASRPASTPRSSGGRAARDAGRADAGDRPPREQPRDAGDGRLDQPLRRPVRHGVGHHERLPQTRERPAGDAADGGARHLRGADRDRDRPVRGDSGGRRLQPLRRPGQPPRASVRHVHGGVLDDPAAPRDGAARGAERCRLRASADGG